MKNKLKILLVFILIFLFGCIFVKDNEKAEIYVPEKWNAFDCIREIGTVWCVSMRNVDTSDIPTMKKLVQCIWQAEKDGKTQEEINNAFENRKIEDIIENGI